MALPPPVSTALQEASRLKFQPLPTQPCPSASLVIFFTTYHCRTPGVGFTYWVSSPTWAGALQEGGDLAIAQGAQELCPSRGTASLPTEVPGLQQALSASGGSEGMNGWMD